MKLNAFGAARVLALGLAVVTLPGCPASPELWDEITAPHRCSLYFFPPVEGYVAEYESLAGLRVRRTLTGLRQGPKGRLFDIKVTVESGQGPAAPEADVALPRTEHQTFLVNDTDHWIALVDEQGEPSDYILKGPLLDDLDWETYYSVLQLSPTSEATGYVTVRWDSHLELSPRQDIPEINGRDCITVERRLVGRKLPKLKHLDIYCRGTGYEGLLSLPSTGPPRWDERRIYQKSDQATPSVTPPPQVGR